MSYSSNERKQYLFAVKQLVSREIKRKYARSNLGIIWSVLNPLMTMAVMSMIFSTIFQRSIENFPIYYLTGNIFWQLFSSSTTSAMTGIVDNKSLLMKVKLPKQTFVLARVYTALANFGYTCIAYVLMLAVFRIKLNWAMLLFPLPVICILLFSLGMGYALSIFYVFFADIKYLYSVILTLWMYMSALFYPIERVADVLQKIVNMNPVYANIAFAREIVLQGTVPDPMRFVQIILWGVGSFIAGYWIFRTQENHVMQRV